MRFNKTIKRLGGIIFILLILSLFISIWLPFIASARAVFGGFYVLFAPGLVMSYVFFENHELNFLERLPIGFAFSLVVVPLSVFMLNRIGMIINPWTLLATITAINMVSLLTFFIRKHFSYNMTS